MEKSPLYCSGSDTFESALSSGSAGFGGSSVALGSSVGFGGSSVFFDSSTAKGKIPLSLMYFSIIATCFW